MNLSQREQIPDGYGMELHMSYIHKKLFFRMPFRDQNWHQTTL